MIDVLTRRFTRWAGAMVLPVALGLFFAHAGPATAAGIDADEAHAIGMDAYTYFYSLITMDLTRRQLTNHEPAPGSIYAAPNSFANIPEYPTADMKVVVRPNFDTLYSSAWLDLT